MLRGKDICSCDEARFLLEALQAAYVHCPLGATKTAGILKKALDTHWEAVRESQEAIQKGTR
jgi:hypothetical protein